jgi:hypothetical protein
MYLVADVADIHSAINIEAALRFEMAEYDSREDAASQRRQGLRTRRTPTEGKWSATAFYKL